MWQITRPIQPVESNSQTSTEKILADKPIVMLTEADMFELADFMVFADVTIDDGVEFGLANELSFSYTLLQPDVEA